MSLSDVPKGTERPPIESRPTTRFRELLRGDSIIVAPGAHDGITARLIASSGFPAVYMGGAGTTAAAGIPDIQLFGLEEMVRNARLIADAVTLPVICDADTGYGNAANVLRTVREFERAGVAGIHLEDQVAPKRCGHLEGKEIVPIDEMVPKLRAACAARRDPDFTIIARTDARAVEGFESAVTRAHRFREAGADLIFPEALENLDEFAEFARRVPGPLLANMTEFGKTPAIDPADFERIGYRVVIYPATALRVALFAMRELLADLGRSGAQAAWTSRMMTRQELYSLIDYPRYQAWE